MNLKNKRGYDQLPYTQREEYAKIVVHTAMAKHKIREKTGKTEEPNRQGLLHILFAWLFYR